MPQGSPARCVAEDVLDFWVWYRISQRIFGTSRFGIEVHRGASKAVA